MGGLLGGRGGGGGGKGYVGGPLSNYWVGLPPPPPPPPPPLFHIEIEGKCGWIIGGRGGEGGGGGKGYVGAPLSNYWVGLPPPPPFFFEDNSSTHYYLAIIPKLIK